MKPLAILTFANDRSQPDRILDQLEAERTALLNLFRADGQVEVWASGSAPIDLIHTLNREQGCIVIFHFGGHGNGTELTFEAQLGQTSPLASQNLAQLLGQETQYHLKLVFLNACATRKQVETLWAQGIPAVIATDRAINDTQACDFAKQFYQALLRGRTLGEAFQQARIALEGQQTEQRMYRSLIWDEDEQADIADNRLPWGLYYQDEAILEWNPAHEDFMAETLRQGSQTYFARETAPGRRLHVQNFEELLLTSVNPTRPQGTIPDTPFTYQGQQLGRRETIERLWAEQLPHCLILGEGGLGKTVSMVRLWEAYLSAGPIPLFIALNEYNQAPEGSQDFLIRYLAKHYLGQNYPSPELLSQLQSWLQAEWPDAQPKALILLDGFNEVSADSTGLLRELDQWRREGRGLQFVLTSRYEVNLTWAQGFHPLALQPLSAEQRDGYLRAQGLETPEDEGFATLLGNPMLLTLYGATADWVQRYQGDHRFAFKTEVASMGELLWNFLEAQVAKLTVETPNDAPRQAKIRWLLRHLLPWVGYEMEQREAYTLKKKELHAIIQAYGESQAEDWEDYGESFPLCEAIWEKLDDRPGPLPKEQARRCLDDLRGTLRMVQPEGEGLAFLHQNFRDFFAALHIRHQIQADLAKGRVPRLLKPRALSIYLRRLLAEIEGEKHNAARLIDEQWSIVHQKDNQLTQSLDCCRGKLGKETLGLAVFNLLEMIHEVRGEWTGLDFRNLDLRNVSLNRRRYKPLNMGPVLLNSYVCSDFLFHRGHTAEVYAISYHPNGKRFISGSRDLTIKEWDCHTGACIRTFEGHTDSVNAVTYLPINAEGVSPCCYIITASADGSIKGWDQHGNCVKTWVGHTGVVTSLLIHPDGKRFFSASLDGSLKSWDLEVEECLRTFTGHAKSVTSIAMSPDGIRVLSGSTDRSIKEWDIDSGNCLNSFDCQNDSITSLVTSLAYRKDGKYFISGFFDGSIKEWDINKSKCCRTIFG